MAVAFGEDDQLGMLSHVDEAKRLEARSHVRAGRVDDLGRVLDETVPVFPGRYFRQTLVTTAHHANAGAGGVGENQVSWVTEQVAGTMQLGTHLDALSHLQLGDRAYNGLTVAELASDAGVKRLGVETVPQIVTRGWLVDVSDRDPGPGYPIAVDDLAGIEPGPGDAVLFHTGWGGELVESGVAPGRHRGARRGDLWRRPGHTAGVGDRAAVGVLGQGGDRDRRASPPRLRDRHGNRLRADQPAR